MWFRCHQVFFDDTYWAVSHSVKIGVAFREQSYQAVFSDELFLYETGIWMFFKLFLFLERSKFIGDIRFLIFTLFRENCGKLPSYQAFLWVNVAETSGSGTINLWDWNHSCYAMRYSHLNSYNKAYWTDVKKSNLSVKHLPTVRDCSDDLASICDETFLHHLPNSEAYNKQPIATRHLTYLFLLLFWKSLSKMFATCLFNCHRWWPVLLSIED